MSGRFHSRPFSHTSIKRTSVIGVAMSLFSSKIDDQQKELTNQVLFHVRLAVVSAKKAVELSICIQLRCIKYIVKDAA